MGVNMILQLVPRSRKAQWNLAYQNLIYGPISNLWFRLKLKLHVLLTHRFGVNPKKINWLLKNSLKFRKGYISAIQVYKLLSKMGLPQPAHTTIVNYVEWEGLCLLKYGDRTYQPQTLHQLIWVLQNTLYPMVESAEWNALAELMWNNANQPIFLYKGYVFPIDENQINCEVNVDLGHV